MSKKWLRFADLKARGVVNNRTTLARWVRDYGFPPGTKIGPNTRAWTEDVIEAYEAARTAKTAECAAKAAERDDVDADGNDAQGEDEDAEDEAA